MNLTQHNKEVSDLADSELDKRIIKISAQIKINDEKASLKNLDLKKLVDDGNNTIKSDLASITSNINKLKEYADENFATKNNTENIKIDFNKKFSDVINLISVNKESLLKEINTNIKSKIEEVDSDLTKNIENCNIVMQKNFIKHNSDASEIKKNIETNHKEVLAK